MGSIFRSHLNGKKWDPYLNQNLEILVEPLVELEQKKRALKSQDGISKIGVPGSESIEKLQSLMMPRLRVGP